jgi:hypothetical protein
MSREYHCDIVIVGGGLAGSTAALAAKRLGVERVLLLEKTPMVGGMAVAARVHSMLTFHGIGGQRIVGGIAEKIVERLRVSGGSCGHIRDTVGVAYSVTPFDPDSMGMLLRQMLDEAGVHCIVGALFTDVSVQRSRITEIRGFHCGIPFTARAPLFLDASGSGGLASAAGASYRQGRDGALMPATLIFSVDNVDLNCVREYMAANRDEFHHETLFDRLHSSPAIGVSGFFSLWREAGLSIPRDRILFYQTMRPGEVAVNSTRINGFNPLDPDILTASYLEASRQVREIFSFLTAKVPGFSRASISNVAPYLGIREVRRIKGLYTLSADDVISGRRFPDEIALGGFPVDIHSPSGAGIETVTLGGRGFYGIPLRCLMPEGIDNLMVAGKCLSSAFEAHASARVQATCMAMGEAAGTALAIALKDGKEPKELDAGSVRESLAEQRAILEPGSPEELP